MKQILALILLLTLNNGVAQDTIIKLNGKRISAQIIEERHDKIKFKRFNDLEGPIYSVKREKVYKVIYEKDRAEDPVIEPKIVEIGKTEGIGNAESSEIKYLTVKRGKYYEGNKEIRKKEFLAILETNPFASNELQRRRNLLIGGWTCIAAGTVISVFGAYTYNEILLASGSGWITTGAIVGLFAPRRFWSAVEIYNRSLDEAKG